MATTTKKAPPAKKTAAADKPATKKTTAAKPVEKKTTTTKPAAKKTTTAKPTAKVSESKSNDSKKFSLKGLFSKNDTFKDPFAKDMVKVCAGLYTIGTWARVLDYPGGDKRRKKELKIENIGYRTMTITKEYQICKYVVTQKQWKLVMGEGFNPSRVKGDDLPVTDVSYDDIMKFIKKLNTLTGKKYRLPSEAEWEWAARGASKDKDEGKYAGCDKVEDLGKYAWFIDNSDGEIHPVGKKKSNELGLYDMTGNVFEFCQDMFSKEVVGGEDYIAKKGEGHVVKGGSYWSFDRFLYRNYEVLYIGYRSGVGSLRLFDVGFRLAHDLDN